MDAPKIFFGAQGVPSLVGKVIFGHFDQFLDGNPDIFGVDSDLAEKLFLFDFKGFQVLPSLVHCLEMKGLE